MRTKVRSVLAIAITCSGIAGCPTTAPLTPTIGLAIDAPIATDATILLDAIQTPPDAGVVEPTDAGKPPADNGPPAATWTQVYSSVIASRCGPCHTTPGGIGITSGQLDMTSQATAYANLVGVATAGSACAGSGVRVSPGAPDMSILFLKVSPNDPAPCGGKMPLGGPPLSQEQSDLIASWITDGAQNN